MPKMARNNGVFISKGKHQGERKHRREMAVREALAGRIMFLNHRVQLETKKEVLLGSGVAGGP
jgi:hypothetical protein